MFSEAMKKSRRSKPARPASVAPASKENRNHQRLVWLASVLESSPDGILSFSLDRKILSWNPAAQHIFGYTPDEVIGRDVRILADAANRNEQDRLFQKAVRGETIPYIEIIRRKKNGEQVDLGASLAPVFDENGKLVGGTEFMRDITERKRAEEALRTSEGRLSEANKRIAEIFESTTDCFLALDADWRITYVNKQTEKFFGLKRKWMVGRIFQEVLPRNRGHETEKQLKKVQKEKTAVHFESVSPTTGRWVEVNGFPSAGGVAVYFRDISDRKRVEEALQSSEERYRLLVDGARDYAMFLLEPNGRITYWSAGAKRVFGWTAKEMIGRTAEAIFTPEDRARRQMKKEIAIARRKGAASDRRWQLRKDGSRIWVDGVMRRLEDRDTGEVRGFAKIARDATEEHKAQEAIEEAYEELEARVLARTAQLTAANESLQREMEQRVRLEREILSVSERERRRIGQDLHDTLCQELAAAAFLLQSMANKSDAAQAVALSEAAQIVNANVGLARDLARGLHPVELGDIGLTNALRELAFRSTGKVECLFESTGTVQLKDETLAFHLYRIAQEAVTNALKHGNPQKIVISVQRDRTGLTLSVRDNGNGFLPKKARKGMGIHIMTYRANICGGELSIESQPKRGTRVTCRIPARSLPKR